MNKPLKRNYKTQRGYDNAMKNYNSKKDVERKQKRTKSINKEGQKNFNRAKKVGKNFKKNVTKAVKTTAPKLKNAALKIGKGVKTVGKFGGRGIQAAVMYKTAKDAIKPFQKGPDGKRRGLARIPGAVKNALKDKKIKLPNNKKLNPLSDENKKIRAKKASMTKDNAGKTKAQIAALKRKRDNKTVASVNEANKKKMRDAARKRNEAFQRKRKLKISNKKKKRPALTNIK
jgi:hypothetical protein